MRSMFAFVLTKLSTILNRYLALAVGLMRERVELITFSFNVVP